MVLNDWRGSRPTITCFSSALPIVSQIHATSGSSRGASPGWPVSTPTSPSPQSQSRCASYPRDSTAGTLLVSHELSSSSNMLSGSHVLTMNSWSALLQSISKFSARSVPCPLSPFAVLCQVDEAHQQERAGNKGTCPNGTAIPPAETKEIGSEPPVNPTEPHRRVRKELDRSGIFSYSSSENERTYI